MGLIARGVGAMSLPTCPSRWLSAYVAGSLFLSSGMRILPSICSDLYEPFSSEAPGLLDNWKLSLSSRCLLLPLAAPCLVILKGVWTSVESAMARVTTWKLTSPSCVLVAEEQGQLTLKKTRLHEHRP